MTPTTIRYLCIAVLAGLSIVLVDLALGMSQFETWLLVEFQSIAHRHVDQDHWGKVLSHYSGSSLPVLITCWVLLLIVILCRGRLAWAFTAVSRRIDEKTAASTGSTLAIGSRRVELDGIRGWAALSVILFHFFQETFGVLFPAFHSPFFNFILDGHLDVLVFFILSGDALSSSFFANQETTGTARIVVVRYLRLTFPILLSCMLELALIQLGWTAPHLAGSLVKRDDWYGSFLNFDPNFFQCLYYALGGVYFDTHGPVYNPFLWTMPVELFGSLLVFVNILIYSRLRSVFLVLGLQIGVLLIFCPVYSLFIFGVLLGHLRTGCFFDKVRRRFGELSVLAMFAIACVLISLLKGNFITIFPHFTLNDFVGVETPFQI